MGYQYYLARDDSRTLYELGKNVSEWRDAFGKLPGAIVPDLGPPRVTTRDVSALATVLREALAGAWGWDDIEPEYFDQVAADIVRWADGHEFVFVGESDRRVEGWYPTDTAYRVTGSRFEIKEAS